MSGDSTGSWCCGVCGCVAACERTRRKVSPVLERRCVSRSPGFQRAVTEHAVDGVRAAGVAEPVGGEVTRLDDTSCPLRPTAECPERRRNLEALPRSVRT